MSLTDFLIGAPKFITNRFNSVNKYVWQTLFPEKKIKELLIKLKTKAERRKEIVRLKSISDEASIVVFLFLINKFFTEGSKAAKDAVDSFKELKIDGFYIGQNFFSGRNEKVLLGDEISKKLLNSIEDEEVKNLIYKSEYVSEIIDKYKNII